MCTVFAAAETLGDSVRWEVSSVLMREDLFQLVDQAFDPCRARDVAASMTQYYRIPGSSDFHEATRLVESAFAAAGFSQVRTEDYPVDSVWEPVSASLSVMGPKRLPLVDFQSAPSCIAWWSDSTADEGEVLEIVDVGNGETLANYEGLAVRGKVVFIHGTQYRSTWWHATQLAADHGVRGIVTDYMLYQTPGIRTPDQVPDAVQLLRLHYSGDHPLWAFSVSRNASMVLQQLMSQGSVSVEAHVQAREYPGHIRNVTATIPGGDANGESLLFCAHTSGIRPGANCAEGVGLVVELARALRSLIESGAVDRPRRSLRFLIGSESSGIQAYLNDHPEEVAGIISTFTYCSPGHRQDITKSNLMLYRSPDSVPSFINDYLVELMEVSPKEADWVEKEAGQELSQIRFMDHYYTPWSDNHRFASAGLPAPLFMSWPDRLFHSQLLTPEVIDPMVLRRVGLVSGVAGLELADAGMEEAKALARLVAPRAMARLVRIGRKYGLGSDGGDRACRHLAYQFDRDCRALQSIGRLTSVAEHASIAAYLESLMSMLEQGMRRECESLTGFESYTVTDDRIPRPLKTGPPPRWSGLDYESMQKIAAQLKEDDDRAGMNSLRIIADETWAFVNGSRTVSEVADAVGFEFDLNISSPPIAAILQGLEVTGYIAFT